jgi:hypothetical protein
MKYPRLQNTNTNENNVDIPYGLKKQTELASS